jgi:hypothetical protein
VAGVGWAAGVPGLFRMDAETTPDQDMMPPWPTKKKIAREDLASQTLPSRHRRQKQQRDKSIHEKQRKAELQKPKLLRRHALMNSSSPHRIPNVLSSLACLYDLSMHDLGLFLLSRLAILFPRHKTFRRFDLVEYDVMYRPDPNGLVPGLGNHEARLGVHRLLGEAWDELASTGYIAEAPRGNKWHEITDKGWAVLESNTVKVDDDYIDTILP